MTTNITRTEAYNCLYNLTSTLVDTSENKTMSERLLMIEERMDYLANSGRRTCFLREENKNFIGIRRMFKDLRLFIQEHPDEGETSVFVQVFTDMKDRLKELLETMQKNSPDLIIVKELKKPEKKTFYGLESLSDAVNYKDTIAREAIGKVKVGLLDKSISTAENFMEVKDVLDLVHSELFSKNLTAKHMKTSVELFNAFVLKRSESLKINFSRHTVVCSDLDVFFVLSKSDKYVFKNESFLNFNVAKSRVQFETDTPIDWGLEPIELDNLGDMLCYIRERAIEGKGHIIMICCLPSPSLMRYTYNSRAVSLIPR